MSHEPHRWHYDYVRIAWDSGFHFDDYKSKKTFSHNGMVLIDIDRIIKTRDIACVERHIDNILEYNLEADELRILDPRFVNLFRLSQLAVEYLIHCKKYLDTTVKDLKTDLQKICVENDILKQDILKHEKETQKLKNRLKDLKTVLQLQNKHNVSDKLTDGIAIFQCTVCNKTFVSDSYLKSHMLRRHEITENYSNEASVIENTSAPVQVLYKAETDRLQTEIKELKEKLNNTERYLKNDDNRTTENKNQDECHKHVENLNQQFEMLKSQIESELKVLQAHKYEHDKYDEWMSKVFSKIESQTTEKQNEEENKNDPIHIENSNLLTTNSTQTDLKDDINDVDKPEITEATEEPIAVDLRDGDTQTSVKDFEKPVTTEITPAQFDLEVVEMKIQEKTKEDINKLGEHLVEKMAHSFLKIETQMESFWNKLKEIESQQIVQNKIIQNPPESTIIKQTNYDQSDSNSTIESNHDIPEEFAENKNESIKKDLLHELKDKIQLKVTQIPEPVKATVHEVKHVEITKISTDISTESESESESSEETPVYAKPSKTLTEVGKSTVTVLSTLRNRSITSLENALNSNPDIFKNFRSEMQEVVSNRLKDLGIDPEWERLPKKSFIQKNEIVSHHRNLAAKSNKSFFNIRQQLLKVLDQKVKEKITDNIAAHAIKESKLKTVISNVKNKAKSLMKTDKSPTQTGIYKLTVRKEDAHDIEVKEIKKINKYEDIDTNENPTKISKASKSLSSLDSLKKSLDNITVTNETIKPSDTNSSISEIEFGDKMNGTHKVNASDTEGSISDLESDKNLQEQKGVLKNYPSVGSLVKKKVLFHLESNSNNSDVKKPKEDVKANTPFKDDDSTSSIPSSIFDKPQKPKKHTTKALINVVNRDSDLDISDIVK